MQAEISYDLVMDDEMSFVEGSYRLPGDDWQVFIFSRKPVTSPEFQASKWESGVTGIHVRFPEDRPLNKAVVETLLAHWLSVSEWVEVRGPDSMQIR